VTRFVRILACDRKKGERLRLEQMSGVDGCLALACESVHPEQIDNPDAHHYVTHELIDMRIEHLRWLHQATGELLAEIDDPEAAPSIDGEPLAEAADFHDEITQTTSVDAKFDKGGE
jgi:hypothetical protein